MLLKRKKLFYIFEVFFTWYLGGQVYLWQNGLRRTVIVAPRNLVNFLACNGGGQKTASVAGKRMIVYQWFYKFFHNSATTRASIFPSYFFIWLWSAAPFAIWFVFLHGDTTLQRTGELCWGHLPLLPLQRDGVTSATIDNLETNTLVPKCMGLGLW